MNHIIVDIEKEIEQKKQAVQRELREIQALEQALMDLRTTGTDVESGSDTPGQLVVSPIHFKALHGREAINSFFRAKKSDSASLDEIERTLLEGGAALGKYPKRSVKLAVVNNKRFFSLVGNVVRLLR